MEDLGFYPRKISIAVHKFFYLKDYKPLLQFYSQHSNYYSLLEVNKYFLPFLSEGHIIVTCVHHTFPSSLHPLQKHSEWKRGKKIRKQGIFWQRHVQMNKKKGNEWGKRRQKSR